MIVYLDICCLGSTIAGFIGHSYKKKTNSDGDFPEAGGGEGGAVDRS